ncbi:swi5-dependent recombination DNA repair protein 1 homolog isoform X2 [Channa argus]|uniref:swi5-dependent recombination DNA repair protein 1 homolog isoform X2 n=1 Tax=Channa argus TaxID=215402 RepID=UPI003522A4F6
MEEETEEQRESTESGTTSTQVDTRAENCSEDSSQRQNLHEPGEDDQAEGGGCDGEIEPNQDSVRATDTQDNVDSPPLSPVLTEVEVTPPTVSSHPPNTQNRQSGPCWYCLRSLDSEYCPETPKQESDPLSPPQSSDPKVSFQTDPRPHFGVAWSSRSTCQPLWGSEGPCWGQRTQEVLDETHTCPHCHLGLPPDTLRWHESKCLVFEDLKNSNK